MKRILKKILAITSAMLMLVSMLNIGLTALASEETLDVVSIYVEPLEMIEGYDGVDYGDYEEYQWWNYMETVVTLSNGDVIEGDSVYLYYDDQYYFLEWEWNQDDPWEVGNSYDCTVSYDDVSYTFQTTIVPSPVASVSFAPVELIANLDGSWMTDWVCDDETGEWCETEEYFCYTTDQYAFTVVMRDGTVIEDRGSGFFYDDRYCSFDYYTDQSYDNQWTIGNTYEIQMNLLGYKTVVPATVVASPVRSIEIVPVELIEKYDGWWGTDTLIDEETDEWYETPEYFHYSTDEFVFTVVMRDGTVIEDVGSGFHYNDRYCVFDYYSDQSYENQWTVGNTYAFTLEVLGYKTSIPVSVVASPVRSIEIAPISLIENSDGEWTNDYHWDEETDEEILSPEYFWYEIGTTPYTVTMNDGTVIEDNDCYFEYQGVEYYVDFRAEQTYETRWTVGNTYTIAVKSLGYETTVPVSIVSSPVVSIEAAPVTVYQGVNSFESWYWDDNDNQVYYERYNWDYPLCTVTMSDGTVIETYPYHAFEHNNREYCIAVDDNQGYQEQWQPGNTYTATVSLLDKEAAVSVTVEGSPVVSVTAAPCSFIEGDTVYDDMMGCDVYPWWQRTLFTVTLRDGTTQELMYWESIEFNDRYYNLSREDDQWETPWTAGNTYYGKVKWLGAQTEVPVTIVENPVASVEIAPITFAQGSDGCEYHYDYDTDEVITYDTYRWWHSLNYTVTLKDGTVVKGSGTMVKIGDEERYFTYNGETQSYEDRWLPDNTYYETVSLLGVEADVYINIVVPESENGFDYVVNNGVAYISGCEKQAAYLEIPSEIGGYAVVGVTGLGNAMQYAQRLVIPDSVTQLSGNLLNGWDLPLQKLTIGSGITSLDSFYFDGTPYLDEFIVSENNPHFCSVDGVVYNKAVTEMVVYPPARTTTHTVPETVTDVSAFIDNLYYYHGASIRFHDGIAGYKQVDDVLYNADMTEVILVNGNKTGDYVMPDSVEIIGNSAFMNSKLESVTISQNVTDIVYYNFAFSKNLKNVTLPDNLQSIGFNVFRGCTSLESIDLPEGLTIIESGSFYQSGLKSVKLPSTVEFLGGYVFEDSALETVSLNDGLQWISDEAFAGTPLTSVTIPDSVIYLGGQAFSGCSSLTTVKLGKGISEIPYRCFNNSGVTSMVFPENIDIIGYRSFAGTQLKTVEFQNDAVNIEAGAFSGCPIETLDIPKNVGYIGEQAFEGSAITELTIPDSVTDITYRAFAFSSDLLNIDIGENVTHLDGQAFKDTAWLDSQPDGEVYLEHVFYGYKGETDETTDVVIKDGTRVIADWAFEERGTIGSLHIPASVEYIGDLAFFDCWTDTLTVDEDNPYFCVDGGSLCTKDGMIVWNATYKPFAMEIVQSGKTEFALGEAIDYYDLPIVRLDYIDGSERMRASEMWVRGYDPFTPGKQTVTLKLGDVSASYEITVKGTAISSLSVGGKSDYKRGEPLDLTLTVYYADGTSKKVTDFTVNGYDADTVGEQEIIVSYGGETVSKTVYVDGSMTHHADNKTDIAVIAPVGTLQTDTKLVVEEGKVADVPELDKEVIENKAVAVYDITLKQNGVEVQPDGKVSVSIPVPATMKGASCTVYHIGDDGSVTDMRAQFRDGCMVFDTDGFSYYVLVADKDAMMGDLNSDGIVDIADATMMFRAANGRIILTAAQEAVADVTGDGITDIADATKLFRFANGRIASLD